MSKGAGAKLISPGAVLKEVGSGLRQLLQPAQAADLEEAYHTCANGLLVSHSPTLTLLRITGERLIQDAIEPLETMARSS